MTDPCAKCLRTQCECAITSRDLPQAHTTGTREQSEKSEQRSWHGILGQVVDTIEPHSEADPVALLVTALVRSAAALGDKAWVPVSSGGKMPPRVFALLVGSSARARKGTADADIADVFDQAEPDFSHRTRSGLSSGEGLAASFAEIDDNGPQDGRLLVIESEFARVLQVIGREGNTLSTTLRDLWDKGNTATLTRANPIRVEGAHLCLIAHVTAEELHAKMRAVEIANGFGNRFLIAQVRRSKRLPHGGRLTDLERSLLALDWHRAIEAGRAITGPVARDSEASAAWAQWYDALSDDVHGLHGSLIARSEAHVTRLSLVFALLDGSPVITLAHHRAAVAIWDLCEASVTSLYPPSFTTGNVEADRVYSAVLERGAISRGDVHRLFHGHLADSRLDAAIGVLTDRGLIEEAIEQTGGRPRQMIRVPN